MKSRRVLLLLTEVFAHGGIQRFNRTLLDALATLGCDCDVYTLGDTDAARQRWLGDDSRLRVRTFAGNKLAFASATATAIAGGRYDDVLIGHLHFLQLAVRASGWIDCPRLLLVAHGLEVWGRVNGAHARALAHVDRVLCVSRYTAQSMRAQAPRAPADRFVVFPNALAEGWVAQMSALVAQDSPPPHAGQPYILAVTRLTQGERAKGVVTTLEAFAQLPDRGLRFVIAGGGGDRAFLAQVATRLGVAERVTFAGEITDAELVRLYRHCRAFVLPSGQEGFGIVFIEAMFFGAPVIAAREKGAVDVVSDGETGLLVPYGDVVALAAAITRATRDEPLRAKLIASAAQLVHGDGRFTARAFARRLDAVLGDTRPARRLVFVNRYFHPDESATSRMLTGIARGLSRSGERVAIVTSRQLYGDANARLAEQETFEGIEIHRLSGASHGRAKLLGRAFDYLSFHVAARRRLRRLLQPGDIVIAKTDPPMLSVSVAGAARARGALLVNWLQDVFPEVADELGVRIRPRFLARLLLRWRNTSLYQADCNVAIGTRMAERLVAQGVASNRIRVIPNWADLEEIRPQPVAGNPIRAELGLEEKFVVGYSGNLGRAHEFDTFLEAAKRLRDDPQFVFLITGGGVKFAALEAAVAAAGLTSFRFQRYQPAERLSDSMAAADVHLVSLLPSIEGLIVPSKYYGVMAAGRPALFIGDEDGELARDIRAADTGRVFAPGDGAGLAAALRELRADPGLVADLGVRARAAALARHSREGALALWLGLLRALPLRGDDRASAMLDAAPTNATQSGT